MHRQHVDSVACCAMYSKLQALSCACLQGELIESGPIALELHICS